MKRALCIFFLLILFCISNQTKAQLTVAGGSTPAQLVQMLLGANVTASNVTYTGAPLAIGTFNGAASNIGLTSGVLITSGSIFNAPGPNNVGSLGTANFFPGDTDLTILANEPTHDAAILEFDFVPYTDTISFRYVFASEEYPEFVCSNFNDVFGFFISGPGYAGAQNIALVPGTAEPVSVNTVNNGSCFGGFTFHQGVDTTNLSYFVDNTAGATVQYDGFTQVFTAKAVVQPCKTYHIRLAIADGTDYAFDSGIFLEMGSFTGNPVVAIAQATSTTLGCSSFTTAFTNTSF